MVKTNRRKNTKRKSKRGYNKRTYNKRTYNRKTYNRNKYTKKGGTFFMGHLPMVILGLLDLGFISYLMYDIKTPSTPSQPGTYTPSPVQQQQVVTPGQPHQQLQQQQMQQMQQQQMQQPILGKENCKSEEFVLKKQGDGLGLLNNEDDKQIFTIEKTKINEFKQKIKEKTKLLQQKINQYKQREINLKEEVRQKLLKEYKENLSTLENSVSSILKERQGRSDDLQDKERTHQLRKQEMETRLAEAKAAAAKKAVTVRAAAAANTGSGGASNTGLYPDEDEIEQMKQEILKLKTKIQNLETPGTDEFTREIEAIFKDQVTRDPSLLTIKGEIETIYEDFTDIKEELTRLQKLCKSTNKSKGFFSRKKDKSGESLDKELLIVKGALYAALKNGYIHEREEVDVKTDIIDVMFQDDTKRDKILEMFNSEIGNVIFRGNIVQVSQKRGVYKIINADKLFTSLGLIKGIQGALASVFKLIPNLLRGIRKPGIPHFITGIKGAVSYKGIGEKFTLGDHIFHLTEKINSFISSLNDGFSSEEFKKSLSGLRPNLSKVKTELKSLIDGLNSATATATASDSEDDAAGQFLQELNAVQSVLSVTDDADSGGIDLEELKRSIYTLREKLPELPDLPDLSDFQSRFIDLFPTIEELYFCEVLESETEKAFAETSTLVQDPTSDTGDAQNVGKQDTSNPNLTDDAVRKSEMVRKINELLSKTNNP